MSQIASYLGVILPKPLCFNELSVPTANNYKFAKRVAQLNLNIIYLCLNIGMNSEQIQPSQTLHNLYLFIELLVSRKQSDFKNTYYNKDELAEKLYQFSLQNAKYLDELSSTNDGVLNDSDDECNDYNKNQRVS